MENGKVQILKTNLQPSFWRKLRKILKQNKKEVLLQFLFGTGYRSSYLEDQIQTLQNQVNSLQQKIIQLEHNQNIFSEAPKSPKIDSLSLEQGDYSLEGKKGSYLTENHRGDNLDSNSLSEPSKIDFKTSSNAQQYNISLNQYKDLDEPNFITLGKISEEEKIEIIKLGFQLQAEGKISLKKYYESRETDSLFQLKGYSIKYESIRHTRLYQGLKE